MLYYASLRELGDRLDGGEPHEDVLVLQFAAAMTTTILKQVVSCHDDDEDHPPVCGRGHDDDYS